MSQKLMLRTACGFVIAMAFLFTGTSTVKAQAPANDNFADASVIDSFPFDTIADLTEATIEITDPNPTCGGGLGKTVWYRYTPNTDTFIKLDLWDGWPDEFDVSVYRQVSGELELLKCDQFYDPPSYLWLTAGEVYYFMVNTSTSDTAYVYFRIDQIQSPPNDHYSQADPVSIPFYQYIDIRAATLDPGEPIPTCVSASMGRTIWITFTPDAVGSILAYNQNWNNSFWAIYTGNTLESLEELHCSAGGEHPMVEVLPGQQYYFQVGSIFGDADWVDFYLNFYPRATNDNFADAKLISSTPFEDSLETNEATVETNEPIPECLGTWYPPEDNNYHTIWYTFTAQEDGIVQGLIQRDFYPALIAYTGTNLTNLTQIGCWRYLGNYAFNVQAGVTYYLQIGGMYGESGWMDFQQEFIPAPLNDDFVDSNSISLDQTLSSDNFAAGIEPNEPSPSCGILLKTVWFSFTPTASGSVTADPSEGWNFVAAYTGNEIGNLTEIGCRNDGRPLPILVEAGITYYFQVGSMYDWWDSGLFTFQIYETPPPTADFGWSQEDPNIFDTVEFCDWSQDPIYMEFVSFSWDFGGGTTTTDNCVYHTYSGDGDYTVFHNIQTSDGRTDPDGITKTVSVRTHDVAAVRVAAPKAASAGQTRTITVYIKNNRYPEQVEIQLYKTIPGPGTYELVNVTTQSIPVRGGNRTTPVTFLYTFTQGDADIGKVSFKAVVNLMEARDALPADNEAISPPTKVQ